MILSCPKCSVKYSLDPLELGAEGRTVRCSRCGHTWWQDQEELDALEDDLVFGDEEYDEDDEPKELDAEESFADILEQAADDERPPEKFEIPAHEPGVEDVEDEEGDRESSRFALACFVLLLLVTLAAAFGFKQSIVAAWPPSAKFYETLGVHIPVKGEGLRLSDLSARARAQENSLMIEARLANITEAPVAVPEIALIMQDEAGETVREERLVKENAVMQPGESQPLTVTLQNVPENAKTVIIRIAQ